MSGRCPHSEGHETHEPVDISSHGFRKWREIRYDRNVPVKAVPLRLPNFATISRWGRCALAMAWTLFLSHSLCGAPQAECRLFTEAEGGGITGGLRRPASIFGDRVSVPAFTVRVVELGTGRDIPLDSILVRYTWTWLEHPYPEHPWGALVEASDIVECKPAPSTSLLDVPAYEVRPRGWYSGRYVWWPWPKRPTFRHLEITVLPTSGWGPHVFLKKSDFTKFASSIVEVAVASKTPADPPFKVKFVRQQ